MADVFAVAVIFILFGVTFPGLLTGYWLLFPGVTERARRRVERTPGRSFLLGVFAFGLLAVPIIILLALPVAPLQALGWFSILLAFAFIGFGGAGLAAAMASRFVGHNGALTGPQFVRGALALTLAIGFPLVGWFVLLPVLIITGLGATIFAVLRWQPGPKTIAPTAPVPTRETLAEA